MAGQSFVHKRIVRIQQTQHAPVFTHDAGEQQLGLPAERLAEVLVEIREHQKIRRHLVQVAKLQPLAGESGHQRLGPFIGDHASNLRLQHLRFVKPIGDRETQ